MGIAHAFIPAAKRPVAQQTSRMILHSYPETHTNSV